MPNQYNSDYYQKRKKDLLSKGLCRTCGKNVLVDGKTECACCLDQRKKYCKLRYTKTEREKGKQRREHYKKCGLCFNCGKKKEDNGKLSCNACLDRRRELANQLKDKVYEFYGGYKCACCGETCREFLTLDHINNDGAKYRKLNHHTYRWAASHNYPLIFQVLCYNCNCGKRHNNGICPHKK